MADDFFRHKLRHDPEERFQNYFYQRYKPQLAATAAVQ